MINGDDIFETRVSFDCPSCGKLIRDVVPAPATSWRDEPVEDRVRNGEAEIDCGICTARYCLDLQNLDGHIHAVVRDHADIDVDSSDAYLAAEFEAFGGMWDIPQSPSDNLIGTLTDVEQVISNPHARFYAQTLSRMAFIQQFAGLEAYLSDTLVGQVTSRREVLARALSRIKELREMALPLSEIAANPDIVKVATAGYLQGLLYHNFAKIDAIWKVALDFSIFPNEAVKLRMFQAEPIRHDCVHRNGKTKEGRDRGVTFKFVMQMDADIREMLDHIEDTLGDHRDE